MDTRQTKIYFRVGTDSDGGPCVTAVSEDDVENGTTLGDGYVYETVPYRDFVITLTVPVLPAEHEPVAAGAVVVTEDMVASSAATADVAVGAPEAA